ncbi:MAG TPA: DUF115 domain-containing protein, partial [Phycisphaeraceae bacterium]|nr:DUF115 domain-containing protein [Phycisphaeraceae bacterium]
PPSRARLGDSAGVFSRTFASFMAATKTAVVTTLVQMTATVRNTLVNLRQYAGGEGIADLKNICTGLPAIVVSAGPSLHKNISLLREPGITDRCVIIAVQTVLKPLLKMGIKPHFVTALDYHRISRRFYEGLTAEDVQGVQLVCEPKANPGILDSFPGAIRCVSDRLCDTVLKGVIERDMGSIESGATVAHLAFYLAQHLGCDPIILLGQDLGFTDGLYYAPGNPIHDVWAPELNEFRTLEMMEWERILRHRNRLRKTEDQQGRTIYTDEQMHTYQQQFERDFAQAEQFIIDATQGGTRKKNTVPMPLAEALQRYAVKQLPPIPRATVTLDEERVRLAREHLQSIRNDVQTIVRISKDTLRLLRHMQDSFTDRPRLNRLLSKVEANRVRLHKLETAFWLVNYLNQAGAFNRLREDRAIAMKEGLSAVEEQKLRIKRDIKNVQWIQEAAEELISLLQLADKRLAGDSLDDDRYTRLPDSSTTSDGKTRVKHAKSLKVPAVLTVTRTMTQHLSRKINIHSGECSLLELTINRLRKCSNISGIVILAERGSSVRDLLSDINISEGKPEITFRETDGPLPGGHAPAVAAARAFARTCWRSAPGGLTIYDDILAAGPLLEILDESRASAALVAGADWALLDPKLCDSLITRYREDPQRYALTFTQAPPGLCGVVLSRPVLEQLTEETSTANLGAMLGYLPVKPQADPIVKDHCLPTDPEVRQALVSAVCDSPAVTEAVAPLLANGDFSALQVVKHLEEKQLYTPSPLPEHIFVELCTEYLTDGPASPVRRPADGTSVTREPMNPETFTKLLEEISNPERVALTFAGTGDPLLHPRCVDFIRQAKQAGLAAVHLRTDLLVDQPVLDGLLSSGIDIISVNLCADRAATYQQAMGADRFRDVLLNIEYLLKRQRNAGGMDMPWIIPRLTRCDQTYEDIETFYDRWLMTTRAAVIDPMPRWSPYFPDQRLQPVDPPRRVKLARDRREMYLHCDGGIAITREDIQGANIAGRLGEKPLSDLWQLVQQARFPAEGSR